MIQVSKYVFHIAYDGRDDTDIATVDYSQFIVDAGQHICFRNNSS